MSRLCSQELSLHLVDRTTECLDRTILFLLVVCAGSGSEHLPNVTKECGNTRLGQHHRAAKCSCRNEESSRGRDLHRCSGKSLMTRSEKNGVVDIFLWHFSEEGYKKIKPKIAFLTISLLKWLLIRGRRKKCSL